MAAPRAPARRGRRARRGTGDSYRPSRALPPDERGSDPRGHRRRASWRGAAVVAVCPLDGVADHGVADVGEVHADLVGAAGAELHLQLRGVGWRARTRKSVSRAGRRPPRHPLAVPGIAPDRRLHGRGRLGETAGDECPSRDGSGCAPGAGRPGGGGPPPSWRRPAARGVAVQAMDDPRPLLPAETATRPCRAGEARRRASHPDGRGRDGRPGRPAYRSPRATLSSYTTTRSTTGAEGGRRATSGGDD